MKTLDQQAKEFAGSDIVPLDQLSAPIIHRLQVVIRYQAELLKQSRNAIAYMLQRKANEPALQTKLHMTEAEDRLVTILAIIDNAERRVVAATFRAHHEPSEQYGCVDDPAREDV